MKQVHRQAVSAIGSQATVAVETAASGGDPSAPRRNSDQAGQGAAAGGDAPSFSGARALSRSGRNGSHDVVPRVDGYRVTGRLGAGGMGTVWQAVQLGTRRAVALKLMSAAG